MKFRVIDTASASDSVNLTVNTCAPVDAPATARTRNCSSNAVMRVAFALKEITKSTPDAGLALAIVANVVATPPEVWMMLLPESVMLFDPARTLNWTFVLVPLALSVTCTRKPRLPPGRSVVLRPPKPITLSSYPIEARDSTISPRFFRESF